MKPLIEAGFRVGRRGYQRAHARVRAAGSGTDGIRVFPLEWKRLRSRAGWRRTISSTPTSVFSTSAREHVRTQLLACFKKALKPGGVVLVQMHYYPDRTAATVPRAAHALERRQLRCERDERPRPTSGRLQMNSI